MNRPTVGQVELGERPLAVDTEGVPRGHERYGNGREPATRAGHPTTVRDTTGVRPVGTPSTPAARGTSAWRRTPWSRTRLSAAVSAARGGDRQGSAQTLADEVAFFTSTGRRRDVRAGDTLVHRGTPVHEVHLVERGALAVLGEHGGRRPILAFALSRELCCPIPALLHQAAPWDAVAVTDASVITVPAETFTTAVRERWVDRWSTRTVTWLAGVGACVADLDKSDPAAQVAALLLRTNGERAVEPCRRTIADLLDLDDATIRGILDQLELLGAIRLAGRSISVVRPEVLRDTVVGI